MEQIILRTGETFNKTVLPINSGRNRSETPLSIFIDIRTASDIVDFQTLQSRTESLVVLR